MERCYKAIISNVNAGNISETRINEAVKRILVMKLDAGLFTENWEKTEQAFQMLAIPIYKTDLQNAINEMQVPNQPYISFKKFYIYVKTNAKNIVKGNYFARMRVQADLFFRPPYEEAKSIILDSFSESVSLPILNS